MDYSQRGAVLRLAVHSHLVCDHAANLQGSLGNWHAKRFCGFEYAVSSCCTFLQGNLCLLRFVADAFVSRFGFIHAFSHNLDSVVVCGSCRKSRLWFRRRDLRVQSYHIHSKLPPEKLNYHKTRIMPENSCCTTYNWVSKGADLIPSVVNTRT